MRTLLLFSLLGFFKNCTAQSASFRTSEVTLNQCSDDECSKYKCGSFKIINQSSQALKIEVEYTMWMDRGAQYNPKTPSGKNFILAPGGSSSDISQACQGDISYKIYTADKDPRNPDSQPSFGGLKSPDLSETKTIETCKTTVVTIK